MSSRSPRRGDTILAISPSRSSPGRTLPGRIAFRRPRRMSPSTRRATRLEPDVFEPARSEVSPRRAYTATLAIIAPRLPAEPARFAERIIAIFFLAKSDLAICPQICYGKGVALHPWCLPPPRNPTLRIWRTSSVLSRTLVLVHRDAVRDRVRQRPYAGFLSSFPGLSWCALSRTLRRDTSLAFSRQPIGQCRVR